MAGDANRSKRYANLTTEIHNSSGLNLRLARRLRRQAKHEGIRAVQIKEWRTREVAFPMCLPTTLRILNPANLFCNMQCTTVCITATGSRVAKRAPGMCPAGCPAGLRDKTVGQSQRGVSRRSEVAQSPRQPVGQPPESGQPVSLTGHPRGSYKTWSWRRVHQSVPLGCAITVQANQPIPTRR